MLCRARALGMMILVSQHSEKFAWPSTPVSVWLAQEMNEPALDSFTSRYPDQPDLLRLALLDFISMATTVGFAAPRDAKPREGNEVEILNNQQFTSGRIGEVFRDLSFRVQ